MSPILRATDIVVDYPLRSPVLRRPVGAVRAVRGVSLSVDTGRTLGIVGESGSGKSTLGRCLALLERPTAGDIEIDGRRIDTDRARQPRELYRQVQMVFQNPARSLDPRMSVGELVGEALVVQRIGGTAGERRARVRAGLDAVHLPYTVVDRKASELSGGQLQRVAIARSLVLEPRLIVLDEPVSALDTSVQAHLLNLLADLQAERGLSYVFISHDLAVVEYLSHEVLVMYLGKVMESGPAREVLLEPRHPYARALAAAVPSLTARPPTREGPLVTGEVPSAASPPAGCPFVTRCGQAVDACSHRPPALIDIGDDRRAACVHLSPAARSGSGAGGRPARQRPATT